jgi:beta-galactosidase
MEGTYGNYPARARALRTTADLHLTWDVPFEPGLLKAVGMKNGEVATTVEVATTGAPSAISLTADRSSISADRRDVTHVTVEIQDEQGRMVPVAMNEVMFTVEGEGKLIGVDNGDPMSHEDFKANRRRAFNGLCLAIVQSTASAGPIRIGATSPGLASANITVRSVAAGA